MVSGGRLPNFISCSTNQDILWYLNIISPIIGISEMGIVQILSKPMVLSFWTLHIPSILSFYLHVCWLNISVLIYRNL